MKLSERLLNVITYRLIHIECQHIIFETRLDIRILIFLIFDLKLFSESNCFIG